MSLLHIWNRHYYVKDMFDRLQRYNIVKREIRDRLRCKPIGRGNRAWKRYENMIKGDLHLIAGIYIKQS